MVTTSQVNKMIEESSQELVANQIAPINQSVTAMQGRVESLEESTMKINDLSLALNKSQSDMVLTQKKVEQAIALMEEMKASNRTALQKVHEQRDTLIELFSRQKKVMEDLINSLMEQTDPEVE